MAFRFPTGAVKSTEKPSLYLDFTKYNNVVDSRITCSGGANGTRVNSSGLIVSAVCPRIDHSPVSRTNYLPYSTDMTASGWLQDAGGWWTSRLSLDVPPPLAEARVTKFTSTTSSAPDNVFTRCGSLSLAAASRSASIYIYFPSNQGITEYRVRADWQDIDIPAYVSNTIFDQWVRVDNSMTTTGTRTFLDFNIQVNGGLQVPSGVYFYCACPQESLTFDNWIPTYSTAVTVYDCKGLLMEEARTNILLNSDDWSTALFLATAAPVTPATGGLCTQRISFTASANALTVKYVTGNSTSQYANTIRLKAGSFSSCILSFRNAAQSKSIQYTVDLAAVTLTDISYGSPTSKITPSIKLVGGGEYEVTIGGVLDSAGGAETLGLYVINAGSTAGTLDVGAGQCEVGAFATSYIPTVATAVTRTTDSSVMSGAGFSTWFNSSEGTFVVKYKVRSIAAGSRSIISVNDGSNSNRVLLVANTTGTVSLAVNTGGSTQANCTLAVHQTLGLNTLAGIYASNNFASCLNAGAIVTDTSGTVPTVNRLIIGTGATASPINGWIVSVEYYPKARLGDLVKLTS